VPDIAGEPQECKFSPGQYLNAGAWRIQPWHQRMLRCTRRHGITLEPLVTQGTDVKSLQWQPVGGMDTLPRALAQALRSPVRTETQVLSVKRFGTGRQHGVSVVAQCHGVLQRMEADYAVFALPLGQLAILDTDLPMRLRQSLRAAQTADAIKIGFESASPLHVTQTTKLQSLRILWPGGIAPVRQRIACVYGNADSIATEFIGLRADQIARAQSILREVAAQPKLELSHPIVSQWSRIPFASGAATRLRSADNLALLELQHGVAPMFFAGDALSTRIGWQEGALESAQMVVRQIVKAHASLPLK
jgi:monoamine oxidase